MSHFDAITINFNYYILEVSASEVEPAAAVAPLQNRSQAADKKLAQKVEEKKGEMAQAVLNENAEGQKTYANSEVQNRTNHCVFYCRQL